MIKNLRDNILELNQFITKNNINIFYFMAGLYIIGFIIYNIPIAFYFPNLRLTGFRLTEYITASLLWISTLTLLFKITAEVNNKIVAFQKIKSEIIKKLLSIILIISLFFYSFLFVFEYIFWKKIGIIIMLQMPFKWIYGLLTFESWYWEKLIFTFTNISLILFFVTSFYIFKYLNRNKLNIYFYLFLFLNTIFFSQSLYTKIPRTFGGGSFPSVSIIFKKGLIPHKLKNIITKSNYYAYIIDEDDKNYFIIYNEEIKREEFPYLLDWLYTYSKQNYYSKKENSSIIPKENISRITIY